ncbi:uncharacterized protein LOC141857380 [Brevipalpus obovatus]|uniref:uncharacterized protein LOC141857380 n=1 Tax=Brevipalpus obovatus TaxID=246614 RepID=UPI003D9F8C88
MNIYFHYNFLSLGFILLLIPYGHFQLIQDDKLDIISSKIASKIMRGGDLSLAINMIRMKIDTIMNRSNLSTSCADFLELFLDEIEQGTTWTLRLLDAQGKPPAGMMRGKSKLYGSYDECLQLQIDTKRYQNDFPALPDLTTGRYCHIYIPLSRMLDNIPNSAIDQIGLNIKPEQVEKIRSYSSTSSNDYVNPDVHVCIPSTCGNDDINRLIKSASKTLKVHKILKFVMGNCDDGTVKPLDNIEYSIIKLLNTKLSSDSISCLHGIKVLAMIFIVIGHGSLTLLASLAVDFTELQERSKEFPIQYAIQTTPWVDTFFVISGLLVSYHIMSMARKIAKQLKGKSDLMKIYIACRGLLGVYFYRYIR